MRLTPSASARAAATPCNRTPGAPPGARTASIIETVGSAEFVRVRLGLGRPPAGLELSEWVLEPVPEGERSQLDALIERGADAVVSVIVEGVEAAMRNFNGAVPDDATKQGT